MRDFGWDADKLIKSGNLVIKRFNPFEITRSVEALIEQSKGELMIDVEPIEIPKGFKPDRIVVDSLSAVASAFIGKEESYRLYIEQLFNFFEKFGATVFMVTEIVELAKNLTEEFMADGVIVFYYIKHGNVRERAVEILKLRGTKHQERISAFQITEHGIVVYPEQEIFGEV
jgi:KaiC/GvpD/RAD55 family RecA-like ATPase